MTLQDLLNKYGIAEPVCGSAIGLGWFPLVEDLIVKLIRLGWDKQLSQVKEKFGGLRFYIDNGDDAIFDAIGCTEAESFTVCEDCGTRRDVTCASQKGWIRTLCTECRV
jgi:hypothetical protein